MYKIIYIEDYKGKKMGDTAIVENNIAHGLIDSGVAKLYTRHNEKILSRTMRNIRKNRMISPKNKGKIPYITK